MSDLKLIMRVAKEFATPEALKEYLREHPGADPKNHRVTKREDGTSGGGGGSRVKVDKSVAKDLGDLKFPDSSAIEKVRRQVEKGESVSFNLINKAVIVLHDQANKPGLDKDKAKKMRDLRTKLKGLGREK